jgi:hypothetical protein
MTAFELTVFSTDAAKDGLPGSSLEGLATRKKSD